MCQKVKFYRAVEVPKGEFGVHLVSDDSTTLSL